MSLQIDVSPEIEEGWLSLLIAIIERARRDIDRTTTPEHEKQEATAFLQWARETLVHE